MNSPLERTRAGSKRARSTSPTGAPAAAPATPPPKKRAAPSSSAKKRRVLSRHYNKVGRAQRLRNAFAGLKRGAGSAVAVRAHKLALKERADLREALRAQLGPVGKGVPVSRERLAVGLSAYLAATPGGPGDTDGERLAAAAEASGLSEKTLSARVAEFVATRVIPLEDTSKRGAGSAAHSLHPAHAEATLRPCVTAYIGEELQLTTPPRITLLSVQAHISATLGEFVGRERLGRLLREWGYTFGELKRRRAATTTFKVLLRAAWALQASYVHAAEQAGTGTYGNHDESYSNVRLSSNHSWGLGGAMDAVGATTGGLGPRLCFSHVLLRSGFLVHMDAEGVSLPAVGDVDTSHKTAEMMFHAQGNGSNGDYHGNFDGAIFLKYVRRRLIPALKEHHRSTYGPNTPHTYHIQFDNAPYHTTTTANTSAKSVAAGLRFNPMATPRKQLALLMLTAGCKGSITVRHTSKAGAAPAESMELITTMAAESVDGRRGKPGSVASQPEFQAACLEWLAVNAPRVLRSDLEVALEDACKGAFQVKPFFGAPSFPIGAPIELAWAQVKAFVAARFAGKRTLTQLAGDTHLGMYSAEKAHAALLTKGGNFRPDADGRCAGADKLYRHVFEGKEPTSGFHVAVAGSRGLLTGGIAALQCSSAEFAAIVRDSPNRAALRARLLVFMRTWATGGEAGEVGEQLEQFAEEAEEDEDDGGE